MAGLETAESEYRAQAGALTVLTMSSFAPQEELLELLERAPEGGMLGHSDQTYEEAKVTHVLAPEPLTVAELDRVVELIATRETIKEYLAAMERIGHVEALPDGGETRYALTDWMREGVGPSPRPAGSKGRGRHGAHRRPDRRPAPTPLRRPVALAKRGSKVPAERSVAGLTPFRSRSFL